MDKEQIVSYLESRLRYGISTLFCWLSTDGDILGYILSVIHILMFTVLATSILISHTIYPVVWFQCLSIFGLIIVWLQHIFLKVCIVTIAEKSFTNKFAPSDPILKQLFSYLFRTDLNDALTTLVLAETIMVGCFSLELLSIFSVYLYKYLNVPLI